MTTQRPRTGDLVVVLVLAGHLAAAVLRAAAGVPDGRIVAAVAAIGVAVALLAVLRQLWRRARSWTWQAAGLGVCLVHAVLAGHGASWVFLLPGALLVLVVVDRLEALRIGANGVSSAS